MSNYKRVTVYIKQENVEAWEELKNKSEAVNRMLEGEQETASDRHIRQVVSDELDRRQAEYS